MTFEQKIKEMLVENGMFERDAIKVVELAKEDKVNESMVGRWGHPIEDYPPIMTPVLWLSVKAIALEYIDAHCPQAFYRPMFETKKD
ncbi:MAG: hypothetical protein GY718_14450 [Lentisphaerae bacterium]|nr:hypothetical protein [Lentisphaerota bacterium]